MQCHRTRKIVNAIRKTADLLRFRNVVINRRCTEQWSGRLEHLDFTRAQLQLRSILRLVPIRTVGRVYEFGALNGSNAAIFIAGLLVIEKGASRLYAVRNLMAAFNRVYSKYTMFMFNFLFDTFY